MISTISHLSLRLGVSSKKFREITLPLLLTGLALLWLNVGLYTRLAPQPPPTLYNLPYLETFDNTPLDQWPQLGGTWRLADGRLLQDDPQVEAATLIMPLQVGEQQPYQLNVQLDLKAGPPAAGVLFNLQQGHGPQKSQTVRLIWDDGQLYMVCGYVDAFDRFQRQARVRLAQRPDSNLLRLTVLVEPDDYAVQVDNKIVVEGIPLVYRGGLVGLSSSGGPVAFDNLQVETGSPAAGAVVPTVTPAEAPLLATPPAEPAAAGSTLYSSQFQGNLTDSGWTPFAGDWVFEQGSLIQREAEGFDRGISYWDTFSSYRLSVSFRQLQGVGAGVLFNMTHPDSKLGAHLARFTDDGSGIFWGYFDEQGNFNGQGFGPSASSDTNSHTLEVVSGPTSYDVLLDGIMLAKNIPLTSTQGYVGLTSSNSVAAFDSVEILPLGDEGLPAKAPTTNDLLEEAQPLNGDWIQASGTITQTNPALTDFIINTGVLAASYTLDVNLTLPSATSAPDAGGGVIFHMPAEEGKAGAMMIRLGQAGQEALWGYFDSNEAFVGQGGMKVQPKPDKPQHLTLVVRPNNYDILFDGQALATKVPLQAKQGWIGLLSFSGPVVFSDFRLTLDSNAK
jgi:hypothetical protein